jgi:hypothetical protein
VKAVHEYQREESHVGTAKANTQFQKLKMIIYTYNNIRLYTIVTPDNGGVKVVNQQVGDFVTSVPCSWRIEVFGECITSERGSEIRISI